MYPVVKVIKKTNGKRALKFLAIILLFALPVSAWADDSEANKPIDEPPITWVDSSHDYATDRAQALTQWMDNFFGDPIDDLEQAESYLRIEFIDQWEDEDRHNFKSRLRGKVQLPNISRRLNLIFSGEGNEADIGPKERNNEDSLSLQYEFLDNKSTRFNLALGITSGGLRPGVSFRNSNTIGKHSSYRFLERIQHDNNKGFYSTTQLDFYRTIDTNDSVRWSNRIRYGEETEGEEWRSSLSLRQRYLLDTERPIATSVFVTVNGVTEPEYLTKNYTLGLLFRRQIYRDFLFMELQPAYNLRRNDANENRHGVWSILFKLEIALEKDLHE